MSGIPKVGLLSRTVIQSPMAQWILPARIRHPDKNDVIFVGDNFIQIKTLLCSGDIWYLEDVFTNTDFDAKIVSAKIINALPEIALEDQIRMNAQREDNDVNMTRGSDEPAIPPQILVLVMSSKEIVFTYAVESPDGHLEFMYCRRALPADASSLEAYGRHICLDPTWVYLIFGKTSS
jgi:hypothetical protein